MYIIIKKLNPYFIIGKCCMYFSLGIKYWTDSIVSVPNTEARWGVVVYAERGGLRKELALISFVKLVNILFYLWGLALVRTPSEKEFKLHSSLVYPTGLTPTREVLDSVRPKPIFWFWSDTDTQTHIGWYFRADTVIAILV